MQFNILSNLKQNLSPRVCQIKQVLLYYFVGEHVYEVAMYLDLLNSSCFPTWPQVFAIAEQVMMTLSLSDPDLYTHLKSIAKTNMKVNKKVCKTYAKLFFVVQLKQYHTYNFEIQIKYVVPLFFHVKTK